METLLTLIFNAFALTLVFTHLLDAIILILQNTKKSKSDEYILGSISNPYLIKSLTVQPFLFMITLFGYNYISNKIWFLLCVVLGFTFFIDMYYLLVKHTHLRYDLPESNIRPTIQSEDEDGIKHINKGFY